MPFLLCPHASRCPGCPLIELAYPAQLRLKRDALVRALAPYSALAATDVSATAAADPHTAFRVRAKLVVEGTALGLFARGTHAVVDIPECVVLRPRIHAVASALRQSLPLAGSVSSVDLRETDAGVLVTLAVPPGLDPAERRALAERVRTLDAEIVSVAVSTRAADAPQLLGAALEVLSGPSELPHRPDPAAPWHYAAHGAFTQAHAGQIARLHAAVAAEITKLAPGPSVRGLAGLRVLELYAGSGALSLRLAALGADVTLVESFAPAVRMAERAAREQALSLRTLAADAGVALGELTRAGARFDAVIVDPPRRGLAPDVRRGIAALAPRLVLYISCAPETLARDAAHLALCGLGLAAATPFDMIPLSDAVEALARFEPKTPPGPRVLRENATFIAIDKPPHAPLQNDASGATAVLEQVRRLPHAEGAVALAALAALAPRASGVCIFARHAESAPALTAALATGTSEYVVLVRGVMHARGTLALKGQARARYERLAVSAGHSLLSIQAPHGDATLLCRALASLRHPVLGDPKHGDRRSRPISSVPSRACARARVRPTPHASQRTPPPNNTRAARARGAPPTRARRCECRE